MKILDANALLRYLLMDNEVQAKTVSDLIANENCFTTTEVLAEVAYVLSGVYKMPRHEVSWCLHCLLLDVKTDNPDALRYAFGLFDQTSLDFIDCLLLSYHKVFGTEVVTFDKKLKASMEREFGILQ